MSNDSRNANCPIVVGIGEALFDCFPDRSVLGGAPVNFTVHVQQLLGGRGRGVVVSRIGNDALGRQLIQELEDRALSTGNVQIDPHRPTGNVQVELSASGDPQYEIAEDVAWDYIAFDDSLAQLACDCSAVCFGTLAQRSPASQITIQRFLSGAARAIRLLDVNLRQHYITPQILESSLRAANVVKLNEVELSRTSALLPKYFGDARTADKRVAALFNAFELRLIALTRGTSGTLLYTNEDRLEAETPVMPAAVDADGVGAGDACCAGLIYGLLMEWPLDRTLELANRMGAFVACQPGGTPQLDATLIGLAAQPH